MNISTLILRTEINRELDWEELDGNFITIANNITALENLIGTKVTAAQARAIAIEELSALIGAAPGQLATLEALADAIGDDPNFAATITQRFGQIDLAVASKVSSRSGYSLMADSEINRLKDVKNFDPSPYQLKENGKGMVALTEIARLANVTNQDISGKANVQARYINGLTVTFDEETVYGKDSAPVNGNITIDLFDTTKPAKLGVVILMHHRNATVAPTFIFSSKTGIKATKVNVLGGEYKPGVVNSIYMQLSEVPSSSTAGGVVNVVYSQPKV